MTTHESIDLSEREREILRLVATGASNKEIAQQLVISPNTVKVHMRNIFAKIGAASRTEAAMYAVRNQLVIESASSIPPQPAFTPAENQIPISQTEPDPQLTIESTTDEDNRGLKVTKAKQRTWLVVIIAMLVVPVLAFIFISQFIQPDTEPISSSFVANSTERWQKPSAMSIARQSQAAVAYEGAIYVIGGENQTGVTGSVERYDVNTNQWLSMATKPLPVSEIQAVVLEDKIYVPGGKISLHEPSKQVEIYDPRSNTWEIGADLPLPISGYSLVTFEGKILLFGGWDGLDYHSEVYEFDPEENSWQHRTNMEAPRAFAGSVTIGNQIYIAGGTDGNKAYSDILVYRPNQGENGEWGENIIMLADRYAGCVTTLAESIYFIGGNTYKGEQLPPWQYNPQLKGWYTFEAPDLTGWSSMAAVPLQNLIYIFGGQIDGKPTADLWTFQALYSVAMPFIR